MSNDPLALAGIAGLPQEADYDTIYAAVAATERGRRFLIEHASRGRRADSDHAHAQVISAAAERLADIAIELRERAAASPLCDALDAAVRDLNEAVKNGAPHHDNMNGTSAQTEWAASSQSPYSAADENVPSSPGIDSQEFAAAATALAASFNALNKIDRAAKAEFISSPITIPELDYQSTPMPPSADPSHPPRWFIEPPEFIFHSAERRANGQSSLTDARSRPVEPPSSPQDDPGDLFEPVPEQANRLPHASPHVVPVPALPGPATPSAAGVVESQENRPPHGPASPVVRAVPRPAPIDPLAALRALSEEELIALFG